MALELKDRIYTNCSTIGEADIEIGAPKEGYQGWEAITDGSTVYYCITDDTAWEVGYGVKTGTNIVRNLLTSNTGSLLSLNGNSSVFCTYPAEKAVFLNLDDNIEIPNSNINAKKFSGDGGGITNINAETNNLAPEAPNDGETYARNNKTWVSISDSAGIPDAPVDGLQYGRQDGEWTEVESGTNGYTKAEIDAQQNAQDVNITANTNAIANLPSPVDTYTKAEINASQDAQDVEIAKKANTSDTYTKAATDTLLDSKANVGDSYTKAETYSSVEVDGKLFEKADKTTTYTKTEVDNSQDAQDTNISNNTSAIGTLSGRVSANEQDIATLQDGIFFSSSYTTDYPSNPNRDPETGNIYLQDLSAFTYSYADANQVFISKTDEQGNVRQFTAVKPDDILVLNQVESPNYGRYKVSSVNDLGDYVNVIMDFQVGEGTVLEGDTLALQAFPASEGGTGGGIPEAPIDGKQYGRQDATWTEVTGGEATPSVTYTGAFADSLDIPSTGEVEYTLVPFEGEGWVDGKYTVDTDGSFIVNAKFQWSLVNPASNQAFRYCLVFVNNILVYRDTHGVNANYPYGSLNQTTWVGNLKKGDVVDIRACQGNVDVSTQTVAINNYVSIAMLGGSGTGGGGGSYTPEPLVWEHVNSSKTVNTDYVNTNDTPLLVQFGLDISNPTGSANYAEFLIDGNVFGGNGKNTTLGTTYTSPSFTVPAGSTYQMRTTVTDGTVLVSQWREAKLPLAVATGGGSYTPESLVWEDKKLENDFDVLYTNDSDVPRYVEISLTSLEDTEYAYANFLIDGKYHASMGKRGSGIRDMSQGMFIVPAGSTYNLEKDGNVVIGTWWEAKMPLAIGVPSVDTAIGMVAPFAMDSVPTGWLHCDGSAVSRDTYSLLYSKVGDTYGNGDGSTTFNLPDLQDEFIRGSSDTLPVGNKQDDEFKAHKHGQNVMDPGGGNTGDLRTINLNPSTEDTGSSTAIVGGEETRPRNVAMLYCINATAESSSGGSYTPEKMEWKVTNDPIRKFDTVYTNDSDTPRFVNLNIKYYYDGSSSCAFYIDGEEIAEMGRTATPDAQHLYTTQLFVVPSGSTYELKKNSQANISQWWEADMPVAIGTGGSGSGWEETVLFENATGTATDFSLSESYDNFDYLRFDTIQQSGDNLKRSDMFPVNICDKLVIDNYYNYYMWLSCDDKTNFTVLGADNVSLLKVVGINTGSGGGSGGSIWSEEDGVATYNGDIKVNGVSVEKDSLLSFYPTDKSYANIKFEWDTGEAGYLHTTAFNGMKWTVNGNEAMKITDSGELYYQLRDGSTTFRLLEDGRVWFPKVKDTITENPPNLFINSAGELIKSTATTYSTEEVDKRLAIKDKLIEKLSARLDELEKKVK